MAHLNPKDLARFKHEQTFANPDVYETLMAQISEDLEEREKGYALDRRKRRLQYSEAFCRDVRAEFWGDTLSDQEYRGFITSPAVALFSQADFKSWGVNIRNHASGIMRTHIVSPDEVNETHILTVAITPDVTKPDDYFIREAHIERNRVERLGKTDYAFTRLSGQGNVYDTMLVPAYDFFNRDFVVEFAYPGTLLYHVGYIAKELVHYLNWPEVSALDYVATGRSPAFPPLWYGDRNIMEDKMRTDEIILHISPFLSPKTVAKAYATIRAQFYGQRKRTLGGLSDEIYRYVSQFLADQGRLGKATEADLTAAYKVWNWPSPDDESRDEKVRQTLSTLKALDPREQRKRFGAYYRRGHKSLTRD